MCRIQDDDIMARTQRLARKPETDTEEPAPPRRTPVKTTRSGATRQLDPLPAEEPAAAEAPEPAAPPADDPTDEAQPPAPAAKRTRKPKDVPAPTAAASASKLLVLAQLAQSVTDVAGTLGMGPGDVLNAVDAMLVASGELAPPQAAE